MSKIRFKAQLFKIDTWTLVRLPESASAKLPSRGMVMVDGTIDGVQFQAPLEPDGRGSHWFKLDKNTLHSANVESGNTVELEIEPSQVWPRPDLPEDLKKALEKAPQAQSLWSGITPKAQWEWIRWIRATNRLETRSRRIEVAISKLTSGMRRPCCFNSGMCTEPSVSKNGVLLEPALAAK